MKWAPDLPFGVAIGNPPYARESGRHNDKGNPIMEAVAALHVKKALACANVVGFLLRLAFVAPKKDRTAQWWRANPPARIYTIAPRPSFVGGGTDNSDYAFVVWSKWDRSARMEPLEWGEQ